MNKVSNQQHLWAARKFAVILFGVAVSLAIIATAAYDAIVGHKIGLTAAGYGLFWLFGLYIFLSVGASIIYRRVRRSSARGDNQ